MKRKIVIWGGNKRPLSLDNLDSHASVSAYFLSKYLRDEFEVINLVDMDKPEELLAFSHVDIMFSTFQKGFTNRERKKRYLSCIAQQI